MPILGLWNKQIISPSMYVLKQKPKKEIPVVTPHPDIVEKFTDDNNKLISAKGPMKKQDGGEVEKKKKKKKRLPGEKMLKKLVNHKDPDIDEKKMKRILDAIKKCAKD